MQAHEDLQENDEEGKSDANVYLNVHATIKSTLVFISSKSR